MPVHSFIPRFGLLVAVTACFALSACSERGSEIVDLAGVWEFRFETDEAWTEVQVPEPWILGDTTGDRDRDVGVYRNTLGVDTGRDWAVGLGEIISAYELSADGIVLGGRGRLPPSPEPDHGRWMSWALPQSATADGRVVLEIRVWDPAGGQPGGLSPGPLFHGPRGAVERSVGRRDVDRLVLAGIFLAVGFYHLFLFAYRPKLKGYLYFGLLSVTVATYSLSVGQWRWQILDDFEVWKRLEMLSIAVVAPLALLFVAGLLERPSGRGLRIYLAISVAFATLFAFGPFSWVTFTFPAWLLWSTIAVIWTSWFVYTGWRDRHPEAKTLTAGYALAAGAFLHDIAAGAGLLTTPLLATYGFAVLTFAMALSLAHRFMRIHEEVDDLRMDLERRVSERTAELVAARDEARSASAAKSSFLAHMSHEIRTPMNGVLGVADLLARSDLNESQSRLVETIRSSASVLLRILGDLLDLSRIEAGRLELQAEDFDLHAICRNAISLAGGSAGDKELTLRVDLADDVPRWVHGDAPRLGQVLFNLLNNAVKFTEEGVVELRVQSGDDDIVRFLIRDTGIGMGDETLHRVFLPFEQGDSSTQRRFGGSGLGLAISRRLVQLAGGRIDVASLPGAGSEFLVEMPLPESTAEAIEESGALRAPTPDGLRVLLVEDEPVNRMVAQAWLETLHADVTVAQDGVEALEALENSLDSAAPFQLVLMDCRLPRLDGYETTTRWREIEAKRGVDRLPIVALTAHAIEGEEQRCREAGMDDFLTKPLRTQELQEVLERQLSP